MTTGEQMKQHVMSEVDRIRAEREAKERRATLIELAGRIVSSMMAAPIAEKAPIEGLAGAAVKIAAHVLNCVDKEMAAQQEPLVQQVAAIVTPAEFSRG